ncbi:MAG: MXAN_2562 family outer membrane beta-barrel protein [Polyangiaceae bacterium]|nr:MXAN_2562 family outer membrane beta-barrel protein [Polyangiaceae bacterium]
MKTSSLPALGITTMHPREIRPKSKFIGLSTLLVVLGISAPSWAHDDDALYQPKERRVAPTYDPTDFRTEQQFAFEFRFGQYRPNVDSEFDGSAAPFEDIFGTKKNFQFGFEGDWQALRIPWLGTLGPGLGWGYVRYSADSPYTDEPSIRSPHPTTLWVMPMYAVAVLRADVLARKWKIPIVPYAKAGLSWAIWKSRDAGELSEVDGVKAKGSEVGYQLQVGGMLWLNWLAPQRALDMDNSTGVNNSYLFGEFFYADTNSFGKGMQVGTKTWVAGIAFEL